MPALVPYSDAVGVGSNNPNALSSMRRAGVARAEHSPLRIEPQRGQVSENTSKPSTSERW
jgi:hypothetical protein